ncbi:MAG: DUF354 domain-containing protein [Chloroflexi bacterium]|jgi:hypothetical protein|nr:DUF354 domain-containing protein [Chloroflexota bacterium]
MRLLVDIGHPAHVHFFKNAIWALQSRGHNVLITARKKEIALDLLDAYGFDYALSERRRECRVIGHSCSVPNYTLALRAGINMPKMLYEDMHDNPVKRVESAEKGVKWIDFYPDLYDAARELITGRMKLGQCVISLGGKKGFAVVSRSDPWPLNG